MFQKFQHKPSKEAKINVAIKSLRFLTYFLVRCTFVLIGSAALNILPGNPIIKKKKTACGKYDQQTLIFFFHFLGLASTRALNTTRYICVHVVYTIGTMDFQPLSVMYREIEERHITCVQLKRTILSRLGTNKLRD